MTGDVIEETDDIDEMERLVLRRSRIVPIRGVSGIDRADKDGCDAVKSESRWKKQSRVEQSTARSRYKVQIRPVVSPSVLTCVIDVDVQAQAQAQVQMQMHSYGYVWVEAYFSTFLDVDRVIQVLTISSKYGLPAPGWSHKKKRRTKLYEDQRSRRREGQNDEGPACTNVRLEQKSSFQSRRGGHRLQSAGWCEARKLETRGKRAKSSRQDREDA